MAKARDELGVPDVSSHSFRKAVATLIDDAGRSARIGADHLGHAKVSMTQDRYPRTGPPPGRRPAGASRQGRRVRIKRRLSADLAFQPDRKPAPTAPTATLQAAAPRHAPGSELPPSPPGFRETHTLGQTNDALISLFGADLTITNA